MRVCILCGAHFWPMPGEFDPVKALEAHAVKVHGIARKLKRARRSREDAGQLAMMMFSDRK